MAPADSPPVLDLRPQGDGAIRLGWTGEPAEPGVSDTLTTLAEVRELEARLAAAADDLPGLIEIVPGYATVTVFYRPEIIAYSDLSAKLRAIAGLPTPAARSTPRDIVLPTVYGGEAGPDLAELAERAGLTVEAAIRLHSGVQYEVAMIGFQPGFPYLIGLPQPLYSPRLATPRLQVPAGSVAIGGQQTGVYPFAAPGGWRLIGRTAVQLFDPTRAEPCLCRPGDRVRFEPVGSQPGRAEALHAAG